MKLELKHLAPYLPYKLGVASGDEYDSILNNIGVMGTHYDVYAPNNYTIYQLCKCEDGVFKYMGVRPIQVKPILRPLSSMTVEEVEELNSLIDDSVKVVVSSGNWVYIESASSDPWDGSPTLSLDSINIINEYLFKNHFDVFNLIENNLAIDKTKL